LSKGQDCIIDVATHYGLECLGFDLSWWPAFPHLSRLALGPPRLLYSEYLVPFLGIKQLVYGIDHPAPSSAEE
jgi:hypothetical protein